MFKMTTVKVCANCEHCDYKRKPRRLFQVKCILSGKGTSYQMRACSLWGQSPEYKFIHEEKPDVKAQEKPDA